MKNMLCIMFIFLSINSFAQEAPLEDHTWYLEKLIIGGQTILTPNNSEVNEIITIFNNSSFETFVCNDFWATFEYSTNPNSFYATYVGFTFGSCNNNNVLNQQFEDSYTQEVFIFNEYP